jgi:hypothetical protein
MKPNLGTGNWEEWKMIPAEREDTSVAGLQDDIAFYDSVRSSLEADHLGKWVLVRNKEIVGLYDKFEAAAKEAVQKFGRGPYLIRQIGASSVNLPTSLVYGPFHAYDTVRL